MRSEPGSETPGRSIAIGLKREGWTGRASFVWVRCDFFPELASDFRRFLHKDEIRYYETLSVEKRRLSYLLGRFTAKRAVRHYSDLAVPDTQLQIVPGVFSQPVLLPGFADPVGVSISHSESLAASIVFPETHPMAVDVEVADENRIDIMKTQILDEELALALPHCTDESVICTTIWTAKEALSKVLRCGMTCPFELLAISEFYPEPPGFSGRFRNFGQYKFLSWRRNRTVVSFVLPRRTSIAAEFPDCL